MLEKHFLITFSRTKSTNSRVHAVFLFVILSRLRVPGFLFVCLQTMWRSHPKALDHDVNGGDAPDPGVQHRPPQDGDQHREHSKVYQRRLSPGYCQRRKWKKNSFTERLVLN